MFLQFQSLTVQQTKEKELRDNNILREADRRRVEGVRAQVESQLEEKEQAMAAEREEFEMKRKEFSAMLDELEEEINRLEKERKDLKSQLQAHSGRRLGGRIMSSGGDASSADLRAARMQIDLLQQAVSFARAEAARAQATAMRETLATLTPLVAVRELPAALRDSPRVLKEANSLTHDLLLRGATVRVIDISSKTTTKSSVEPAVSADASKTAGATTASVRSGAAQLAETAALLTLMRQRATGLRGDLRRLLARGTGRPETYFGDTASDAYVKLTAQREKPLLAGRVTLPAAIHARGKAVHLGASELRALHAALL